MKRKKIIKKYIGEDNAQIYVLQTHLKNHSNREFNNLPEIEIRELKNLETFKNFEEIKNEKVINHRLLEEKDYDIDTISVVDHSKENLLRWLGGYNVILFIILMIALPILLGNYWLYFFFFFLPLSALASSPGFKPFKYLFWSIVSLILGYGILVGHTNLVIMSLPILGLKFSKILSRRIHEKAIIHSAKKDELFFKYLYVSGKISVYDSENDRLYFNTSS